MSQVSDLSNTYTEFSGLNQLKLAARKDGDSPEVKHKVAEQFEAIFLQIMLKSMREASQGGSLFDNDQSQFYQEMFDQQMALHLSTGKGFGLADAIYRQIGGVDTPKKKDLHDIKAEYAPTSFSVLTVPSESEYKTERKDVWDDPESFVGQLYPYAIQAANKLKTQPEVILSIAALETGWGKHVIKDQDGQNSFNLFGIKADAGWSGKRVSTYTLEYDQGMMQRKRQQFRAYDQLADAFEDFTRFLKTNPRYQNVLAQSDKPEHFIRALKQAGYATDPLYDEKVLSVLDSSRLQDAIPKPIL